MKPSWAKKVDKLCLRGNAFAENERFEEALAVYQEALALVPEPHAEHFAATWIFTALGDVYFLQGNYPEAQKQLISALRGDGGIGNPFIHLRRGQVEFELGNMDKAADNLMRAYMGEGPEMFQGADRKYLEFLATVADAIEFPEK